MRDEEAPPLLSRSEALALPGGPGTRSGAAGPRWRHACHVLLYAPLPAGSPEPPFAVLMQLRFDGLFGFPGGMVDPRRESLEEGLLRELREELGEAAGELRLSPGHHRGARAWAASGRRGESGRSEAGLVTHFYVRRLRLEELREIESGEKAAPEHGLEVQGLVRVPLGGGLPNFLQHRFIGDARAQLLGALPELRAPPDGDESPPRSGGEGGRT